MDIIQTKNGMSEKKRKKKKHTFLPGDTPFHKRTFNHKNKMLEKYIFMGEKIKGILPVKKWKIHENTGNSSVI